MKAIPNKIIIGDTESPILVIENDNIESISEESAVSLIGDELFIDQFIPTVKYCVFIRYVFKPTNYDRFITADGLVMCGHYNYDLRLLPYGTKITFCNNDKIVGIFYSDTVERVGKEKYKINAMSAIGLMNRQRSKGGIYTGQTFEQVLGEILGNDYEYVINDDVKTVRVYGWLPYATRRKNLHQLIMAYGVNIIRTDEGKMLFAFLANSDPQEIPDSRIFIDGNIRYNDPASRVEVTEHAFHYLPSVEEEVLFDNTTSDAVSNAVIIFNKPIEVTSLRCESGNLTISANKGVNYAVVSGIGVLVGKPYTHTRKVVSVDNEEAVNEKVVRVEEATLVTLANSENVLLRVSEYYFNATTVTSNLIVDTEKTGRRYSFNNAFHEYTSGFVSKMSSIVSSFKKANCEFIQDYVPKGAGASFTKSVFLTASSGTWTIPQEVFAKETPIIRVVLIGDGYPGTSGTAGTAGTASESTGDGSTTSTPTVKLGKGGEGGLGGSGGEGGKIFSTTINCSGMASFNYGRTNKNAYFSGNGVYLNSLDGASNSEGFLEIFSGAVFALPGHEGQAGAKGGDGGLYLHEKYENQISYAENGESVTYNGITYSGGVAGKYGSVYFTGTNYVYIGNGGGGGAAVKNAGGNGKGLEERNCEGGAGANGSNGDAPTAKYGCGGNGGNGGGGGGGAGVAAVINLSSENDIPVHWHNTFTYSGGNGGNPGAGSDGYQGCIIIYY